MRSCLFIDSWGWLVLANQREKSFSAVQALYQREKEAGTRLVTSDYVLDEVMTFLFAKAPCALAAEYVRELLASTAKGHIQLERIGPDRFAHKGVRSLVAQLPVGPPSTTTKTVKSIRIPSAISKMASEKFCRGPACQARKQLIE